MNVQLISLFARPPPTHANWWVSRDYWCCVVKKSVASYTQQRTVFARGQLVSCALVKKREEKSVLRLSENPVMQMRGRLVYAQDAHATLRRSVLSTCRHTLSPLLVYRTDEWRSSFRLKVYSTLASWYLLLLLSFISPLLSVHDASTWLVFISLMVSVPLLYSFHSSRYTWLPCIQCQWRSRWSTSTGSSIALWTWSICLIITTSRETIDTNFSSLSVTVCVT